MPTLKTTATPSTDLYYEDRGQGPAIVLIHGWPLSGAMWESQVNGLVDAGFRCIAYDRRGFGRSGRPGGGYDYDTFASDLHDVVTMLGLESFVLAGFSMGGGEVARYVGRYGTAKMAGAALISAITPFLLKTPDNPDGVDGAQFDGMIAGLKKDRIGFLNGFFPKFFNREDAAQSPNDDVIPYAKSIAWPASPLGTQECVVAFGTTDFRADLRRLDVPTLIIHGDADQIVPFEVSGKRAHEMLHDSTLEVISGAPHGLAATHAERLTELLRDFMRAVSTGTVSSSAVRA